MTKSVKKLQIGESCYSFHQMKHLKYFHKKKSV